MGRPGCQATREKSSDHPSPPPPNPHQSHPQTSEAQISGRIRFALFSLIHLRMFHSGEISKSKLFCRIPYSLPKGMLQVLGPTLSHADCGPPPSPDCAPLRASVAETLRLGISWTGLGIPWTGWSNKFVPPPPPRPTTGHMGDLHVSNVLWLTVSVWLQRSPLARLRAMLEAVTEKKRWVAAQIIQEHWRSRVDKTCPAAVEEIVETSALQ